MRPIATDETWKNLEASRSQVELSRLRLCECRKQIDASRAVLSKAYGLLAPKINLRTFKSTGLEIHVTHTDRGWIVRSNADQETSPLFFERKSEAVELAKRLAVKRNVTVVLLDDIDGETKTIRVPMRRFASRFQQFRTPGP
jgi:sugar phosphate isomerase/epimerase